MDKLINKIKELITSEEIKKGKLLSFLNLTDVTLLYIWKRGESLPSTSNYIKLAEYLNCSLDFLVNRTLSDDKKYKYDEKKFYHNLRELMRIKNKTRYQMVYKDMICPSASFVKWKRGSIPTIETLIKLADYFSVSVDELLSV